MKIYLDVRNVCRVETDNGDVFELYDTGSCLEISLCKNEEHRKQNMDVQYVNLADNFPLGKFYAIRLTHMKEQPK